MEKRELIFMIGFLLIGLSLSCLSLVSAVSGVNVKLTGTIGDYSSDVRLVTGLSGSTDEFDAYDMDAPSSPSDYASFYSTTTTDHSLAIDSWDNAARTLNLVYDVPTGESGDVTFSWSNIDGSTYLASFSITGDVSNLNMVTDEDNTYTYPSSDDSDIYITIPISNVPAEAAATAAGGGGGGATTVTEEELVVSPKMLDVPIVINTIKIRKISLYNKGTTAIDINIYVSELENIVLIKDEDKSFKLAPGESKIIDVRIAAPADPGIYTGKIIVSGQEVLVTLNVNTKELLFDVAVIIPEEFKTLDIGKRLKAQITLIPMGEEPRVDTTLNYVIKDFEGRTFLTESETMLVDKQKSFMKEFSTENLPPNDYVLGLEVLYLDSVATSSDHFKVREKGLPAVLSYRFIFFLLLGGVLILLILIILITIRHKKIKKYARLKR